MSLKTDNLLFPYRQEAGLLSTNISFRCTREGEPPYTGDDLHWGWESPTAHLRGHFLGHWLAAAARIYAVTGDAEVKVKIDKIIAELAICQKENGGEWCGSIPEKYLLWSMQRKRIAVPHYTLHKTMMGLFHAYRHAGNEQAFDILVRFAKWFTRWTPQFSQEEFDRLLDSEHGAIQEVWADLYHITKKQEHLDLVNRYDRPLFFEPLLAGIDVLTNLHANTTIPQALGAARAYEVTGEPRWRRIVEAYWRCAVTDRGHFCTGGQTYRETWTLPFKFAARLGDENQEHCTVYNMICLAQYLFRWTGEPIYADYIERNLHNGILAQQNPKTGMITYNLPLRAGGHKVWGSPTNDFWCCHGSLVQAHTLYNEIIYFEDQNDLLVSQYIPSELRWERLGKRITIRQILDPETGYDIEAGDTRRKKWEDGNTKARPSRWLVKLSIESDEPVEFALRLRIPWWVSGKPTIRVNEEPLDISAKPSQFQVIRRVWKNDRVTLALPKTLWTCPLPDEPDTVAFMDGPTVLAGLCQEQYRLIGDKDDPKSFLVPDQEGGREVWLNGYRTINQDRSIRFIPLNEVVDERYTVYFPLRRKTPG
jgi:DUF1680 family protein